MELLNFINKDTVLVFSVLVLLALSAFLSQKAGIINIALEGQLIAGVLGYTLINFFLKKSSISTTGLYFINVFGAIAFALVLTAIFAFFVVYLRLDQILTALAINIIMYGVASFLIVFLKDNTSFILKEDYVWLYVSESFSPYLTIDSWGLAIFIPLFFVFALILILWFFVFKTKTGLRIRACGESPKVTKHNGLSVVKYQFLALMLGGFLVGFAASFFAEWKSSFSGGVDGFGYLGLSMLILGMNNIWLATLFVFFFSVLRTLTLHFGGNEYQELIDAFNYALPLVVLMFSNFIHKRTKGYSKFSTIN